MGLCDLGGLARRSPGGSPRGRSFLREAPTSPREPAEVTPGAFQPRAVATLTALRPSHAAAPSPGLGYVMCSHLPNWYFDQWMHYQLSL